MSENSNEKEMNRLLPCPFCSSEETTSVTETYKGGSTYVVCKSCGARGPRELNMNYSSIEIVIGKWNKAIRPKDVLNMII